MSHHLSRRARFWQRIHLRVNDIGWWLFSNKPRTHPWWRLNFWLADKWTPEWLGEEGERDTS